MQIHPQQEDGSAQLPTLDYKGSSGVNLELNKSTLGCRRGGWEDENRDDRTRITYSHLTVDGVLFCER